MSRVDRDVDIARAAVAAVKRAEAEGLLADQNRPAPTRNRTPEQIEAAAEAEAAMARVRTD